MTIAMEEIHIDPRLERLYALLNELPPERRERVISQILKDTDNLRNVSLESIENLAYIWRTHRKAIEYLGN